MTDIATWLIPLVAVVLGSGGVTGAFVLLRKEARQAPIEWQTAQVANAAAVSEAAQGLVVMVNARLAIQDAKVEAQDAKIDRWDNWYFDLRTGWPVHRLRDTAPPPPQ